MTPALFWMAARLTCPWAPAMAPSLSAAQASASAGGRKAEAAARCACTPSTCSTSLQAEEGPLETTVGGGGWRFLRVVAVAAAWGLLSLSLP